MPKMHVKRSIQINKKREEVFPLINNFENWITWSPWLILEKDTIVNVSEDKKYYDWKGDVTGEGNMKITSEKENEAVESDLNFLKPWKSKAKVGFYLKEKDGGTEVTWTMDSSLPFFLFFMKKMMVAFVGIDFDRGLNMLKDLAEDGKIHSELDFKGNTIYEGCTYIGIKSNCPIGGISDSMSKNFGKLMEFMGDKKELMTGPAFSIYHKWDMVKNNCSYTACIPVSSIPEGLPEGVISGEIPKTKMHTIHHLGAYRHIGNAWSSQYTRQRNKKFKLNKSIDPIEVYLNSPMDTAENELQTEVHFAIK